MMPHVMETRDHDCHRAYPTARNAVKCGPAGRLWHSHGVSFRPLTAWAAAIAPLLVAAACRSPLPAPLQVGAAVSLTEALETAIGLYEHQSGEQVTLTFAASGVVAGQIERGAPVDLFVSADTRQMDRLADRGLVDRASIVPLVGNQLVVVMAPGRSLPAPGAAGLLDPSIRRLALGDPALVPAGAYARLWLERAGVWQAIAGKVVPAGSVRAALAAVDAGNADAAVVYRTDLRGMDRVGAVHVVSGDEAPAIVYPAAVVAASPHGERARALLAWLNGAAAREVFDAVGFTRPGAPAP